jgi:hypothetical protein
MFGFLFSNGNFSQLSTKATMNWGLTADGNVTVGNVTIGGVAHGYIASNDVVVPFDFPFSTVTNAYDITPSGNEIVGAYRDRDRKVRGFVLRVVNRHFGLTGPFEFVTIDYPGATATQPFGNNPQGDVVGTYVDAAGKRHGFLLTRSRGRGDESETGVPQNAMPRN